MDPTASCDGTGVASSRSPCVARHDSITPGGLRTGLYHATHTIPPGAVSAPRAVFAEHGDANW